jgi:hypothetical protein
MDATTGTRATPSLRDTRRIVDVTDPAPHPPRSWRIQGRIIQRSETGCQCLVPRCRGGGYRYRFLMWPQLVSSVGTVPQLMYTVQLSMMPETAQPASL